MSSFSCPHLELENSFCIRLQQECVPGRKGCILLNKVVFAVPAEDRIRKTDKVQRSNSIQKDSSVNKNKDAG